MKIPVFALLVICLAAVAAGAWVRLADLEERPMHADEATGARILADRLDGGYRFVPSHFHGPLLTAWAAPVALLRGEISWQELSASTLRLTPAMAGLLAVFFIPLLRLGWAASAAGMALVATSPLLIYYSRMFIHEPVFVFFALPVLAGIFLLLEKPRSVAGILLLGVGLGCMAATRETVVLAVASWGVAGGLALVRQTGFSWVPVRRRFLELLLPITLAGVLALLIIGIAYAPSQKFWAGVPAFFSTFFHYEVVGGHEKSALYYAKLLLLPGVSGGVRWGEWPVLVLALLVYFPLRPANAGRRCGCFLLEAGVLLLLLHSCFAYKTPWLAMLGWMQICLAAGCGFGNLWLNPRQGVRWAGLFVLVVVLGWQLSRAVPAAFRLAADGRNPYAYVPTSKDLERWTDRMAAFLGTHQELINAPVLILGRQYWPLPWYLRDSPLPSGYLESLPENGSDYGIIIVLPTADAGVLPSLEETHEFIFGGLREDFPVTIAIRQDLWELWVKQ